MGKKILIIDDDRDIVDATRIVLEESGYEVFEAENIDEGFKSVGTVSPDLIILDVMMEKMCDGFELARTLKRDERYKGIPIFMLTAIAEKTGFRYCEGGQDESWLPVDEFGEKPFKPKDLVAKIEEMLSRNE